MSDETRCTGADDCPRHGHAGEHSECRSCHAVVDRATSPPLAEGGPDKRTTMPINRDSVDDPEGNVEVWRDNGGTLRYRGLKKDEDPRPGRHRGISHFATCPDAASWRKSR